MLSKLRPTKSLGKRLASPAASRPEGFTALRWAQGLAGPGRRTRRSGPGSLYAISRRTFTLTELVVVLLILVAVAGIVVPTVSGVGEQSKADATEASLVRIRTAILGDETSAGYVADLDAARAVTPAVRDLLLRDLFAQPAWAPAYDPSLHRGWNGPYLRHVAGTYTLDLPRNFTAAYGTTGDACILDAWGNPIVVQRPTTPLGAGVTEADRDANLRLVSAGPDGVLDSDPSHLDPTALSASRGDDLVLFVFAAGV